jgi:hypothetical protein
MLLLLLLLRRPNSWALSRECEIAGFVCSYFVFFFSSEIMYIAGGIWICCSVNGESVSSIFGVAWLLVSSEIFNLVALILNIGIKIGYINELHLSSPPYILLLVHHTLLPPL